MIFAGTRPANLFCPTRQNTKETPKKTPNSTKPGSARLAAWFQVDTNNPQKKKKLAGRTPALPGVDAPVACRRSALLVAGSFSCNCTDLQG